MGRYLRITQRDHPLADKNGKVRLHRAVLYDAIGDGPHRCYWCKYDGLEWDVDRDDVAYLVVDHLNGDGLDNRLANLAPVHAYCNNNRSVIEQLGIPWSTFETMPPSDRPALRSTHNGSPTPKALELATRPADPQPQKSKRQKREPLRDGLVAWSDLVDLDALNCTGEVRLMPPPAELVERFPQLRRLRR